VASYLSLRAFCIIFTLMAIENRQDLRRSCVLVGFLLAASALAAGSAQAPQNPAPQTAEDLKSRETFIRVCVKCHPAERVTAEGRSRAQWETTIITMQTARGAVVTPEEFDIVLDYLTRNHGRESVIVPGAAGRGAAGRGPRAHVGAADRHRVDDTAAERGKKTYASECVTCHGTSARGTDNGANLIRSPLVLRDRYGSAIGPFLKKGHPMQTGAPSAGLTAAQVTDLSHFIWQRINDTLQGSPAYDVKNVLTGNPKAGQSYFNGEGRCATCHSPAGDLAGYGRRYSPVDIQQRFVFPSAAGRGRGAGAAQRKPVTVTVTAAGKEPVSGVLVTLDDFHVALRDATGEYRSFARTPGMTVVKNDPYTPHVELLDRLTDKAMHDVVAYLETLK
jgi:cytochrome c oxidase cbb3-type subunit 3